MIAGLHAGRGDVRAGPCIFKAGAEGPLLRRTEAHSFKAAPLRGGPWPATPQCRASGPSKAGAAPIPCSAWRSDAGRRVAADVLYRTARLPRVTGLMLVGALASPLALRYIERCAARPVEAAARPRHRRAGVRARQPHPPALADRQPLVALANVLEGVLSRRRGGAGALARRLAAGGDAGRRGRDVDLAGGHHGDGPRARPRGQVAERALLATALNSALAVLLLKGWRVIAAVGWPSPGDEWLTVGASARVRRLAARSCSASRPAGRCIASRAASRRRARHDLGAADRAGHRRLAAGRAMEALAAAGAARRRRHGARADAATG